MRKKCSSCGLICFDSDEICKRCGSKQLFNNKLSEVEAVELSPKSSKKLPFWSYIIFFVIAVIIEFVSLLPGLANMGMRHSANAPLSDSERTAQLWFFILNLPFALLPWLLTQISQIFDIFYLFVPFAQIIFWTIFLAYLWKRLKTFMES